MQIKPTFHRVVVKPINDNELIEVELRQRGSNLIVPETTNDKAIQGIVKDKGPGRMLTNGGVAAIQLSVGDRVVFNRYAGTEIKVDGERFYVISEDDVICRLVRTKEEETPIIPNRPVQSIPASAGQF